MVSECVIRTEAQVQRQKLLATSSPVELGNRSLASQAALLRRSQITCTLAQVRTYYAKEGMKVGSSEILSS